MPLGTKYIGIDYGLKRIGIAVSDETKRYSFQRSSLLNGKGLYDEILGIIRAENAELIVIGYPLKLSSEKTHLTEEAEKFKSSLEAVLKKKSIKCAVVFFDERFTSSLASHGIAMSGLKKSKRRDKSLIDSISAQIILQDYIDSEKNRKQQGGSEP